MSDPHVVLTIPVRCACAACLRAGSVGADESLAPPLLVRIQGLDEAAHRIAAYRMLDLDHIGTPIGQDRAGGRNEGVLRHFQNEPKAWDFVALICYQSWLCERSKKGGYNSVEQIAWKDLAEQLGTTDKDAPRLRNTLRKILLKLKQIWPECQAELERGGVLVVKPPINAIHPVKDR